jgi:hypothetical protein
MIELKTPFIASFRDYHEIEAFHDKLRFHCNRTLFFSELTWEDYGFDMPGHDKAYPAVFYNYDDNIEKEALRPLMEEEHSDT